MVYGNWQGTHPKNLDAATIQAMINEDPFARELLGVNADDEPQIFWDMDREVGQGSKYDPEESCILMPANVTRPQMLGMYINGLRAHYQNMTKEYGETNNELGETYRQKTVDLNERQQVIMDKLAEAGTYHGKAAHQNPSVRQPPAGQLTPKPEPASKQPPKQPQIHDITPK